jgi:hypothetical protein
VLRILYNLYRFSEFQIEVKQLAQYAMRTENQIKDAINTLVKDKYIFWDKDKNEFMIDTNKQEF